MRPDSGPVMSRTRHLADPSRLHAPVVGAARRVAVERIVSAVSLAYFVVQRESRNGIPCDDRFTVPGSVVDRPDRVTRRYPWSLDASRDAQDPSYPVAGGRRGAMAARPPGASRRRHRCMRGAARRRRRCVAAGGALAACGTEGSKQTEASCVSEDLSATEKKLVFSNWPLYIDVDEKDESKRPTLDAFAADSGIEVTYNEDINDNNEFFGKIQNQLAACQSIERDIIVLTDWMAARLIRLGWVQKLDTANLPNVEKNLLPIAARPLLGQEQRVRRAVAVRPRRDRLQRQASPRRSAPSTSCSPGPTSRAR